MDACVEMATQLLDLGLLARGLDLLVLFRGQGAVLFLGLGDEVEGVTLEDRDVL